MRATIDGNEAAASVAYRLNEVCCIYPITPSSPMAELADEWSSQGRPNLWGSVPAVVEMQSEGGAAGALHGALQSGALATTFTASQGLLLMIPNMYKIAGELTPAVLHVAARSLAAQGLSIFGDHADVMAVRQTGFALLASSSVQEAHDLALVAQAATLHTRIPFVHFFDGFRTSHELNTIDTLTDDDLRALVPEELIRAHRARALSPEHPFIRGTAQNPDVYFQARETVNPFYAQVPGAVTAAMDALAARTGRQYHLADYTGDPAAERVIVIMGSGAQTAAETARYLAGQGEKVGVVTMRLFRPFPTADLLAALPDTVRRVAVLDRTKEPGSLGEPLFLDVLGALAEAHAAGALGSMPVVTGGRYGLSSKEFTPGMVAGIFTDLAAGHPKPRFTVGITDDVERHQPGLRPSWTSSRPARSARCSSASARTARSARTRTPSRSSARTAVCTPRATSSTTPRNPAPRRFPTCASDPTRSTPPISYITPASWAATRPSLIERTDVLSRAAPGATLLLNSPRPAEQVWDSLPRPVQEQILAKGITLYAIDASQVARDAGLPGRINTVLQTCFFAISGVLPREEAIAAIKAAIAKTYGRRGPEVVARNNAAVDQALAALHQIPVPGRVTASRGLPPLVPGGRAGVRPPGDRRDDGRARRRPAGQRAAGGRHLPQRHHRVREAQHLRPGRRVGPGPVHPVRQLQLRLPAQRDPGQVLRRVRAGRGPGRVPVDAAGRPWPARHQVLPPGVRGRLHRMRVVCGSLPGAGAGGTGAARHQPGTTGAPGRAGPARHRVLRGAAGERPVPGGFRYRARDPVPAAAVRILRGLRGLRRDALPQAAVPAVRRPADDRERDRVLVDLRRQPAHHAVGGQRRGPRPGLVQLAVRGQRRVRARLPAGRRPAPAAGPRPAGPATGADRPGPGGRRSWPRRSAGSPSWPPSGTGSPI